MIFKMVKSIAPKPPSGVLEKDWFKWTYNDMNLEKVKQCGLFLRDSGTSPLIDLDGERVNRAQSMVININADILENSINECEMFIDELSYKLLKIFNYRFIQDNESVFIVSIKQRGDRNYLGKNEQNIPMYSINFLITYEGGI